MIQREGVGMALRIVLPLALCGLLAAVGGHGVAHAAVLLNDGFSTDGGLNGLTPSPGPGVAWNAGSATGINAIQVAGGEVVIVQSDTVNGEDVANVFADQPATGTTFARFDFRIPAADNASLTTDPDATEGVFFVTLRGTSASTSQRGRFGLLPPAGPSGFRAAINADNSDLSAGGVWASDLAFDTLYRAVISYNAESGQSQFWLNPTSEASTNVSHTGGAATVINRIILRQNDDYAGKQFVDNVVVATTFAEALSGGGSGNFLPADFNKDGNVNDLDLIRWQANYGASAMADSDSDGDSDGADFVTWQRQLGQPRPPVAPAAAAVPEPAAMGLAAWGIGAMFGCRPRSRTARAARR